MKNQTITELCGLMWKGKADVVNHNEKLIIDLKTTNDLDGFKMELLRNIIMIVKLIYTKSYLDMNLYL